MAVTASMVKELRERTGAGMMECKKALVETDGDMEAAAEHLRKSGLAQADKKASRVAAEGKLAVASSDDGHEVVMVEINCETDFVAKDANFNAFAEKVAANALSSGADDVEALAATDIDGSWKNRPSWDGPCWPKGPSTTASSNASKSNPPCD